MRFFYVLHLLLFYIVVTQAQTTPQITFTQVVSSLTRPVSIAHAGDDRIFVVEQAGRIKIVKNGAVLPTVFINITDRVKDTGNEQGLLGLAFDPYYSTNGYFYVNYTNNSGDTNIARFSVSTDNPDVADPDSEVVLKTIDQPYSNHNGGCIQFGQDNFLYIGMGDGGSGGDPENNGQNKLSLLGKILRVDISNHNSTYAIPTNNPFVNDITYAPEIWATGVRNPWRFSFDRIYGDMWIADVGQNLWEEIDFQPGSSAGGENYGWRCYEGTHTYNTSNCQAASNYVAPIYEYPHSGTISGCSVTGGYIYRGAQFSNMWGWYIFADICNNNVWIIKQDDAAFTTEFLGNIGNYNYSSFGEDKYGEIYCTDLNNGKLYKLFETSDCSPVAHILSPDTLNICEGSASQLIALEGENLNYQWYHNGAPIVGEANILPITIPGDYQVIVSKTDSICQNVSQTIHVQIRDNIPVNFIAPQEYTTNVCLGEAPPPVYLLEASPSGGVFSGNAVQDSFFYPGNAAEGTHQVTYLYTNEFGCNSSDTVIFEVGIQDFYMINNTAFDTLEYCSEAINLNVATGLSGTFSGNGVVNNIFNPCTPNILGLNNINYTDTDTLCPGFGNLTIFVEQTLSTNNLPKGFESIKIHPNPFSNDIQVITQINESNNVTLRLFNSNGQELINKQVLLNQGKNATTFLVGTVPSGIYYLQLKTETGQVWFDKLVKE